MDGTISKLFKYKPIVPYTGLEGRIRVKNRDVYVGVEIELEEVPSVYQNSAISKHEDHSLKLHGAELVTRPLKMRYLEIELRRILDQVKQQALISQRCSIHVHMNVRDMTPEHLSNMVMLYMIFERSLYRVSGDRWNNNFCVPLYMATDMCINWFRWEGNINQWSWSKYTGLNLSPIWGGESSKIGTVEFRQHKGSVDVEEIMQWCNLVTALKRAAQTIPRDELLSHIRTMNTTSGYWWLAKEVFGSWAKIITSLPEFKEDTEQCIANLKYILSYNLLKEKKSVTETKIGTSTIKKSFFDGGLIYSVPLEPTSVIIDELTSIG